MKNKNTFRWCAGNAPCANMNSNDVNKCHNRSRLRYTKTHCIGADMMSADSRTVGKRKHRKLLQLNTNVSQKSDYQLNEASRLVQHNTWWADNLRALPDERLLSSLKLQ